MDAGVLPSDVVLTFGCATDEPATRLLRVDARCDRLVEGTLGAARCGRWTSPTS